MTTLAQRLAQLSPQQRAALLDTLHAEASAQQGPADVEDHPLSSMQRRLWFLDRLFPGSPAYSVPAQVLLHGPVDMAVLQRAAQALVDRHPALRTRFDRVDGEPVQQVLAQVEVTLVEDDLRGWAPEDRDAELDRIVQETVRQPFDLQVAPLLRLRLVRLADDDAVLVIVVHHIVSDGWSVGILFRDFTSIYEAFAAGQPLPFDDPAVGYTDLLPRREAKDFQRRVAQDVRFWEERLRGVPQVLEVPADHERPSMQRFVGSSQPLCLPDDLAAAVTQYGRAAGATPFMVLLAAYEVLLHRVTGRDDFVVGIPFGNRDAAEVEEVVGFFANTLPLRADLSGDPTFGEVVQRVRAACLEGYEHPRAPFDRLVESLAPERDLSRSPLVQVSFAFQSQPLPTVRAGGVEFRRVPLQSHASRFDMELQVVTEGERISGLIEYDTDLFDPQTVDRMVDRFVHLVRQGCSRPQDRVSQLSVCDAQEERELLAAGRGPRREWPGPRFVHERVCQVAAQHPRRVAVECAGVELTYAELVARADALAGRLVDEGVRPNTHVGVCLTRSVDMVVSLLAVHLAGGAYLPLDPAFPADRLAYMVEDSRASVVLTRRADMGHVPRSTGAAVLVLDEAGPARRADTAAGSRAELAPDDTAYLIYTSGSTGRPKGVVVAHRCLTNLVLSMVERPGIGASDVMLALTSLSFDISALELFAPLVAGARLVVAESGVSGDPQLLARTIRASGATVVQGTPSMWRMLVASGWNGRGGLTILCGGEPLPATLASALASRCAHLWNMYGPTETTVWSCVEEYVGGPVRLGLPIANTHVDVVDRWGALVPFGVAGELAIRGDGVAKGYWGRPELTAERFVPTPDGTQRRYLTGDVVRRHRDGSLEFLGRVDHQVKVRGFRIELGEVEAALLQVPRVHAAVVGTHEHDGETSLVAWVESRGAELVPARVREHTRHQLPHYMVPAAVEVVDVFELTPNGKVDRSKLPAIHHERDAATPYREPADPLESQVAGLIAGLLEMERVGADDDFFLLGGHSLLATRLVSQLNAVTSIEVPLREVFAQSTVSGIAGWIREHGGAGELAGLPAGVSRRPSGAVVPLTGPQQRMWFLEGVSSGKGYVLCASLDVQGVLPPDRLERAVSRLADRHDVLRAAIRTVDGQPRLVFSDDHRPVVESHDLTGEPAGEAARLGREMAEQFYAAPFDLADGHLLRLCHLATGPSSSVVLLAMHHIVSDEWSLATLLRDLLEMLRADMVGVEPDLPELAVEFADYAWDQHQESRRQLVERDVQHLASLLSGIPDDLALPMAAPRPPVWAGNGATIAIRLEAALVERMGGLAQRHGATPFMVLSTAVAVVLSRFGAGDDIVLGTPVAHRRSVELEPLVGLFVNTLPLRVDLSGEPTFELLLERVRDMSLEVLDHQEASFERLVEVLNPPRELARHPVFQAALSMQNVPFGSWARGGLEVSERQVPVSSVKFDLEWIFLEAAGGIRGRLDYCTDLFDAAHARALVDALVLVLEAAVADPGQPVGRLALMDQEHSRRALELTTGPTVVWDAPDTVPQCIDQALRAHPEAIAVSCGGEQLSCLDLDARVEQLARRLRARGVQRDTLVPVLQERSLEMVTTLLAVMRAGGAYVPLDPRQPGNRLSSILDDCGAQFLLAHQPTRDVALGLGREVLFVDEPPAAGEGGADEVTVLEPPRPEDLVHVIYTSGSTGRPKGALSTHAGLRNRLLWMQDAFGLDEHDRVLQKTPYTFDVSVWEFLWPLMVGARLVVARPEGHRDPRYLAELIAAESVTTVHFVPSMLRSFLEEPAALDCSCLERVVCSGEALPKDLQSRFFERMDAELHNLYGPTEASIDVTWWPCRSDDDRHTVPIGRPIANCAARVLDSFGNLQPVGVPGELYLGGVQLARGYLGRADLTRERFVVDPCDPTGSATAYRTGDLVSLDPDGALVFHGRMDHQVKLRGNRIELGEIEFALAGHPQVEQAVVVVRGEGDDRRLVAFVRGSDHPSSGELRAYLRTLLPEYMVPSVVQELERLPLTPNGKLDRSALPEVDAPRPAPAAGAGAAQSGTERAVAEVWSQLLDQPDIGVDQNFFDLGGHSLLMTRMRIELEGRFGRPISLVDLFGHPTVRSLAAFLDADAPQADLRSDVSARAAARRSAAGRRHRNNEQ